MSLPACTCHVVKRTMATRARSSKGGLRKGFSPKLAPVNTATLPQAALSLKAMHPNNIPFGAYEIEIHLKINSTQNVNAVRGRIFPPFQVFGKNKQDVVLVFAEGKDAEIAKQAGASIVGGSDLITQVSEGKIAPTKVIAHPSQMGTIRQLARFLGPKGLMPSEKRGTVTTDLAKAIQEARGGLDWKADNHGVVRTSIGRLNLPFSALQKNIDMLIHEAADMAAGSAGQAATAAAESTFGPSTAQNPAVQKRAALKKVLLTSTQGPSFVVTDALKQA